MTTEIWTLVLDKQKQEKSMVVFSKLNDFVSIGNIGMFDVLG